MTDGVGAHFTGGRRLMLWSLGVGVVCLALVVLGAIFEFRRAAFSYLMAFIFWHSLAFGALIHLMIQHALNGSWAVVVRRIAEGAAMTFPILLLLFLPLIAGVHDLYPWTHIPTGMVNEAGREARMLHRAAYLNYTFFYLRAAGYFIIWIVIAWLLERWTLLMARGGDAKLAYWQRALSALSLPLMAFVVTFAFIDWVMSLEPEWFSTIFGVYYFAGAALAFLPVLVLGSIMLQRQGHLQGIVTTSHYHGLGKLMLAFVAFWGYIAFSQLLLIWIANVPREVEWYLVRVRGSWVIGAALLIFGHFGLSFFALLSWRLKRTPKLLAYVSIWVLVMHFIDIYWLIMPAANRDNADPHWLDLAALFGIGGIVVAYALWRLRGRPLTPVGDPRYELSLEFYTT